MSISFDNSKAVEAATSPQFFFFSTQRAHSFWRNLWPFQSVRQFLITLALTVGVVIVCSVVVPESVDLQVRLLIFSIFVITVVRELRAQLPGKITIALSRGSARQVIPDIKKAILELGYTDISPSPMVDRFQLRRKPVSDLWIYSPKQDVELCIPDDNIIEVLGAIGVLKLVIMELNWKLEK